MLAVNWHRILLLKGVRTSLGSDSVIFLEKDWLYEKSVSRSGTMFVLLILSHDEVKNRLMTQLRDVHGIKWIRSLGLSKIRMLELQKWFNPLCKYLRPVSGCTRGEWACDMEAAAAAAAAAEDGDGCLGLLTLVLLLANSSLMVWGKSGSKRTPCCNFTNFSNMWKQVYFLKKSLKLFIYSFHLIF